MNVAYNKVNRMNPTMIVHSNFYYKNVVSFFFVFVELSLELLANRCMKNVHIPDDCHTPLHIHYSIQQKFYIRKTEQKKCELVVLLYYILYFFPVSKECQTNINYGIL